MPTNACFNTLTCVGVPRLRRVLKGLAWLYPDIGYCQGTGMVRIPTLHTLHQQVHWTEINRQALFKVFHSFIAFLLTFSISTAPIFLPLSFPHLSWSLQVVSCLLLFLEEEDVLWMMCALIEDLLPPAYFSSTLLGVQTDQRVLRQLIIQYLPALDRLLQEHDIGK